MHTLPSWVDATPQILAVTEDEYNADILSVLSNMGVDTDAGRVSYGSLLIVVSSHRFPEWKVTVSLIVMV